MDTGPKETNGRQVWFVKLLLDGGGVAIVSVASTVVGGGGSTDKICINYYIMEINARRVQRIRCGKDENRPKGMWHAQT